MHKPTPKPIYIHTIQLASEDCNDRAVFGLTTLQSGHGFPFGRDLVSGNGGGSRR